MSMWSRLMDMLFRPRPVEPDETVTRQEAVQVEQFKTWAETKASVEAAARRAAVLQDDLSYRRERRR